MSPRPTSPVSAAAIVPPRSYFYRLLPVGVGGAEVEALGGYVARLAAAHRVTTHSLVCRALVWLARGQPENVGRHLEWRGFSSGKDLDAGGVLHRVLEEATTVPGLDGLTLAPFRRVVADRGLRAEARQWCPACYQSSRHERLAWRVGLVTACSVHGTVLTRACPQCGRGGAPYAGTVRVACCAHCARDLADDHQGPHADAADLANAASVADFLGAATALAPILSPTLVGERLARACVRHGLTMVGACRRFGIPRGTASAWWNGAVTPSLGKAVAIAALFNLKLGEFLAGHEGALSTDATVPRAAHRRRRIRWARVARALETHCDPEESVLALARRLGTDPGEMRRRFPTECAAISGRSDALAACKRKEWLAEETARVCAGIDLRVAEGATPTMRLAAAVAFQPGALRDPALRARVAAHIKAIKQ